MSGLLELASEFLSINNIPLIVKVAHDQYDIGIANYNPNEKAIFISIESVIAESKKWDVKPDDYIILIMAHEVGHFLDSEKEEITARINSILSEMQNGSFNEDDEKNILNLVKKIEINAWEAGEKYIPEHLRYSYKIMNLINLEYRTCSTRVNVLEYKHTQEKIQLRKELVRLSSERAKDAKKISDLVDERINLLETINKLRNHQ